MTDAKAGEVLLSLRPTRRGIATWRFLPTDGNEHCAAVFHPQDYDLIVARGWVRFDGQRANIVPADCDPTVGHIRFLFEKPFRAGMVRTIRRAA